MFSPGISQISLGFKRPQEDSQEVKIKGPLFTFKVNYGDSSQDFNRVTKDDSKELGEQSQDLRLDVVN